jgi:hypothetical protein
MAPSPWRPAASTTSRRRRPAGRRRFPSGLPAQRSAASLEDKGTCLGDKGTCLGDNGTFLGDNVTCLGDKGTCLGYKGTCLGEKGKCLGDTGTFLGDKGTCLGDEEISERVFGAAFYSQCRSGWGRRVVCGWEIRVRVWGISSTRLEDIRIRDIRGIRVRGSGTPELEYPISTSRCTQDIPPAIARKGPVTPRVPSSTALPA